MIELKESDIMRRIQVAATADPNVRLFRNNVGVGWQGRAHDNGNGSVVVMEPRRVKFGLCEGSSDLIGWRSMVITPEMVGKRVAVFVAVEVKRPRTKATNAQANFIDVVKAAGGIADVARDTLDAKKLLNIEGV